MRNIVQSNLGFKAPSSTKRFSKTRRSLKQVQKPRRVVFMFVLEVIILPAVNLMEACCGTGRKQRKQYTNAQENSLFKQLTPDQIFSESFRV